MEYVLILIVAVVVIWFLVDKKDHDEKLKNVGGIRIKYKELIDYLIKQSQGQVTSVDKGIELYLSYKTVDQDISYYITEGFNVLQLEISIEHAGGNLKNKWEFDTRKYNQAMMIASVSKFINSFTNGSDRDFRAENNESVREDNPCYLTNSKILPKKVLEDDTLDLYSELLNGDKITEEFKEAINEAYIPYKISLIKITLNKEYYENPYAIDPVNNHRHIAPSLILIKKRTVPPLYPSWFILAFPDVLCWILNAQGDELATIKREFSLMENNQRLLRQGRQSVYFFIHLIEFYISRTQKSLECRNYKLT